MNRNEESTKLLYLPTERNAHYLAARSICSIQLRKNLALNRWFAQITGTNGRILQVLSHQSKKRLLKNITSYILRRLNSQVQR
jgi:hypothetical protein